MYKCLEHHHFTPLIIKTFKVPREVKGETRFQDLIKMII